MTNVMPGSRLPYLAWDEKLLVEKAADTFIALVCAVWKLDEISPDPRQELKGALMEHFAETFDDCWDNPEDFVSPV